MAVSPVSLHTAGQPARREHGGLSGASQDGLERYRHRDSEVLCSSTSNFPDSQVLLAHAVLPVLVIKLNRLINGHMLVLKISRLIKGHMLVLKINRLVKGHMLVLKINGLIKGHMLVLKINRLIKGLILQVHFLFLYEIWFLFLISFLFFG